MNHFVHKQDFECNESQGASLQMGVQLGMWLIFLEYHLKLYGL